MLRTPEFNERFGTSGPIDSEGFPVVEYVAADSILQGVEAHLDIKHHRPDRAGTRIRHGPRRLQGTDEPLPRMPPFRVNAGLTYRRNALQVGGTVTMPAIRTVSSARKSQPKVIRC